MYADNPAFIEVFNQNDTILYAPSQTSEYHLSRVIAAQAQNIYSASGATKDVIDVITGEMLAILNTGKKQTIITDITILVNNLRYRIKYPVDEECALRMGAILTMLDNEPHDQCDVVYITKKMELARNNPDLYDFFLNTGLKSTPAWKELLTNLEEIQDYFQKRREMLHQLSLQS